MLKTFQLSARFLWREWRTGQWLVMFLAIMIAVSGITALDFYTDRLKRGIEINNATFLGGDLVINSSTPIATEWIKKAKELTLRTAQVWSYPSVVTANNKMQLVNLMAVSGSYPLLGKSERPASKTVWIESRLLPMLALELKKSLMIGAQTFQATRLLDQTNALINSGWLIAPRVMILLDDVPATKTVLPGSHVDYRFLLAGNEKNIQQFKKWISPQLKVGQRLIDPRNQEDRINNVIIQTESFLQLSLLICLAMCSVAVILSVQAYLKKHYAQVALLKSLGYSRKKIIQHYLYKLLIIAIIAGSLGITLGYFAQNILAILFQQYMQINLPPPSVQPVIFGFLVSAALLFIFSYSVISALPKTSPLYIWRNEVSITTKQNSFYLVLSLLCLMFLIGSFMGLSVLSFMFLNAIAVCVAFLYALSLLLLAVLNKILPRTSGAVRRGLSQLVHYPDSVSLQFVSFTVTLMLVIVLGMIRIHLITNWQQSFSARTPNYFAINIAPTDLTAFHRLAEKNNVLLEGVYPMIRGRLVLLNGQPIMQAIPDSARGNNALHRELNLTWMTVFPADNQLVQGQAWPVNYSGEPLISVEKKLADDLALKIGDTLTFQIGEKMITAKIVSFRTVSWTSFHPNFFVIFTPGAVNELPTTFITSFHLANQQTYFLNKLVQQFPNLTIIDVASLLKQLQDVVDKMTYASQYLLIFTLLAAVLVLIASVQSTMAERKTAYALWRILGASKAYIRQSLWIESSVILLLVLFFAMLFAGWLVWLIEVRVFRF